MMLGEGDGLKGCAARTGKRRLRPLTPSPSPSSGLTCRVALALSAAGSAISTLRVGCHFYLAPTAWPRNEGDGPWQS